MAQFSEKSQVQTKRGLDQPQQSICITSETSFWVLSREDLLAGIKELRANAMNIAAAVQKTSLVYSKKYLIQVVWRYETNAENVWIKPREIESFWIKFNNYANFPDELRWLLDHGLKFSKVIQKFEPVAQRTIQLALWIKLRLQEQDFFKMIQMYGIYVPRTLVDETNAVSKEWAFLTFQASYVELVWANALRWCRTWSRLLRALHRIYIKKIRYMKLWPSDPCSVTSFRYQFENFSFKTIPRRVHKWPPIESQSKVTKTQSKKCNGKVAMHYVMCVLFQLLIGRNCAGN